MFLINLREDNCVELQPYSFRTESQGRESIQYILASNPEILLSTDGLNISPHEKVLSVREYQTNRGPIDIVFVTDNADIILVETKLLKNPESHRTVVAQAIDYAKSFSEENIESLKDKFKKKDSDLNIFTNKNYYESILEKNIKSGNYQVLIVGDTVHPNVLGMIDSIQSAPHLAFTLNAISINPFILNNNNIMLNARIESKTNEIERSVISIEIINNNELKIDSSTPEKERKGNKPIITEEIYLNNIENTSYVEEIRKCWNEIEKRGGTIEWGTVGFSGGFYLENKRISLIWVYDSWFNILTKKMKNNIGIITEEQYNQYLDKLKESEYLYEKIVVPNKSEVHFDKIDHKDFKIALEAMIDLMEDLMREAE